MQMTIQELAANTISCCIHISWVLVLLGIDFHVINNTSSTINDVSVFDYTGNVEIGGISFYKFYIEVGTVLLVMDLLVMVAFLILDID